MTVEGSKVLRSWCVFSVLISKRVSHHNELEVFLTCFVPHSRALFADLNLQKCSETEVFWPFLLPNLLCATTRCNFWSLIWQYVSAPVVLANLLFDPHNILCFATYPPFRALYPLSPDSFASWSSDSFSSLTLLAIVAAYP
jgi:hypothetical protein